MPPMRVLYADAAPRLGVIISLPAWIILFLGIARWSATLTLTSAVLGGLSEFWQRRFMKPAARRIKETDYDRARQIVDRLTASDRAALRRYLDEWQ